MSLFGRYVTAVCIGTGMFLSVRYFIVTECVETYFYALYTAVCVCVCVWDVEEEGAKENIGTKRRKK
jgi:hypothetical protein